MIDIGLPDIRSRLPALITQLRPMAAGLPADTLLGRSTTLPALSSELTELIPTGQPFWFQSCPTTAVRRLGIGHAVTVAAQGQDRFSQLEQHWQRLLANWQHDGRPVAFTGFAFFPDAASTGMADWPAALLAVPRLLIESTAGQAPTLTLNIRAGELCQPDFELPGWTCAAAPAVAARHAHPPEPDQAAAWHQRVDLALRDIARGQLDKLVLARSQIVDWPQPVNIPRLLATLERQTPDSFIYAHGDGRRCFLGASPESLLRLQDDQVTTDALAGTAWPGSAAVDSAKNRHEHALVVRALSDTLAGFAQSPPWVSEQASQRIGQLSHLRSQVHARLAAPGRVFELLAALHPSPAVGGYPVAAAWQWLAQHQERRPAWYSGGIGWLDGTGSAEIRVALRSAWINRQGVELHAGAGIVAGSVAADELAETEAKFQTLRQAIDCHLAAT